jgi:hypothetical protein
LAETGLERLRVEPVEKAFKGVVRGGAVGQAQEALEPVAPLAAEGLDLLSVLSTGDHGTQGGHEDVLQVM